MMQPPIKYSEETRAYLVHILNYGKCLICSRGLSQGESVYVGLLADRTFSVACDTCKSNLMKEIKHFVYHPKCYQVPPKDALLWRYMDFPKFVSLLDSGELFFTRADQFEDRFECARGFYFHKDAIYDTKKMKELTFKAKGQLMKSGIDNPTYEEIDAELKKEMQGMIQKQQEKRKEYFVSCWHSNDFESEAMWNLYISAKNQGVAIQSTVERLCYSLDNKDFEVGKVNYISFKEPLDIDSIPVWYKRTAFQHEQEVRAIIREAGVTSGGKPVAVDLDMLIEKVYISPSAPNWFASLVEHVLHNYGLNKKVEHSKLDNEPIY